MDAVVGSRRALPFLPLVFLASLERAAGVQHPAEETLLPLNQLAVQSSRLELPREVLRFVGQLARARELTLAAKLLHLIGEGPLTVGDSAELLLDRAIARHREQAGALPSESPLLFGELIHSLDCLGESRARRGSGHVTPSLQQLVGGRVECVDGRACLFCAFPDVRVGVRDRVARPLHLFLGAAECGADARGDESILARGFAHLLDQPLHTLLDRALFRPQSAGRRVTRLQRLLDGKLTLGQAAGFRQRFIKSARNLLAPLPL